MKALEMEIASTLPELTVFRLKTSIVLYAEMLER